MAVEHPLSPGGSTFAVLDANTLLAPRLSDVLFDFHGAGLYLPRWTEKIEAEFLDHWVEVVKRISKAERKAMRQAAPDPADTAKTLRRLACFRGAVGVEHAIYGYGDDWVVKRVPKKVDAGDVHVVSAALILKDLAAEFSPDDKIFIVSHNTAHLAVNDVK